MEDSYHLNCVNLAVYSTYNILTVIITSQDIDYNLCSSVGSKL